MGLFSRLRNLFSPGDSRSNVPPDVPFHEHPDAILLGVRIPESIYPTEREDKYGAPLDEALQAAGVGAVTGGGTQMGKDNSIEFVDLELAVIDRQRGIEIIRNTMRACGAPSNTMIEDYSGDDEVREIPI